MKIVSLHEKTFPIASAIRNAYIDFSKMTLSAVAVVTDVHRDGKRVVGYGFNSNGRYGQGALIRERFAPRLMEAEPKTLLDDTGDNLDPQRIWACLMRNEKPGGHGERSVAIGTIVVVSHAQGINFLIRDTKDPNGNPFEVAVQDLVSKGVEFRVCEYTLKSRNIDKKQLIDEVIYVPSGVAEVARLQAQEGYAYLKP